MESPFTVDLQTWKSYWYHKAEVACSVVRVNLSQYPDNTVLSVQINNKLLQLGDGAVPDLVVQPLLLGLQSYSGEGSFAAYPRNKLPFELGLTAWLNTTFEPVKGEGHMIDAKLQLVPILFTFVYGFFAVHDARIHGATLDGNTTLLVTGDVGMTQLCQGLVVAMFCFTWLVTGCAVIAAFIWCAAHQRTRGSRAGVGEEHGADDLLGFCGALLFALPTIRTLWPLAPPGGTRLDILGIFAQLVCLSIAIVFLLIRRIVYDWPMYCISQDGRSASLGKRSAEVCLP